MKQISIYLLAGFFILLFSGQILSQDVTIDGIFRPRFENRHGYKTIMPENEKAANFISQRSRLNIKYSNEIFKIGFSIQNVGVWGETKTLPLVSVV